MKKLYPKTLIGISIFFYLSSFGQHKDSLQNLYSKKELGNFKERISLNSLRQKQEIARLKSLGYREFISESGNDKQLIGSDENGRPVYYTTLNVGAAKITKADKLYAGGGSNLDISGQGMIIGQWDFSKPRTTHELLTGKITYPSTQNQTISRHSTNIAGTMVGNNGAITARGLAYNATLRAYDWLNDVSEMTAEAYDSNNLNGILVANNSYGYDPMYLQSYQFGKYNTTARDWDDLMYLKPYLQIVKAAGNARELNASIIPQVSAKGGYDLLEGAGIAKNVLVIASAKKNNSMSTDENYDVSAFSSYGPTDDGRIKPDLCAPGEDMYSAIDTYNQAYGTYRGTSSATAVVSGIVALLQQYWKSVSPSSSYMWSSTVRALLAHTANDKGTEGPDYIYGWGLVDAQRAAQAIHDNIEGSYSNEKKTTLVQEKTLQQGNQYTLYVVPLNPSEPLSATIAWTDPKGNVVGDSSADITSANIINDLDIKIVKVNSNGTEEIFYPWKLGGINNVNLPATQAVNNVDNIERVDIKTPDVNSTYKIIVSTKSKTVQLLPSGFQNFSIVVSNVNFCYKDDLRTLVSSNDDIYSTQIIKAKKIVASNAIKSSAQGVEYIASESINLLPNFQVEYSAGFHAYITPCFSTTSAMLYRAQIRSNVSNVPITDFSDLKNNVNIYPNPAKEEVNILFKISGASTVKISIYDQSGKLLLSNMSSGIFPKGNFTKTIDTSKFAEGIYIMVVETNEYKESKKLIIK